ncbi:hypothetical protein EDC63_108140 [Sulfurirhabdus autotrophica]|uniref:Uncharacterized protein n=1 Tax=Sulfurirhabdus autotrophica TaxID=1706046 RepID=A0A4R3Y365_9PROT|nr:hypothetical protein EDC63_108140 [Sulfurirhabdus autotrophica]
MIPLHPAHYYANRGCLSKNKIYRDGMRGWHALGLTFVKPEK